MKENLEKVFFEVGSLGNEVSESMWVKKNNNNNYIVRNSAFYLYNISFLDEIDYKMIDNILFYKSIIKKSGHSTYRILLPNKKNIDKFDLYWKPIEKLGCSYESYNKELGLFSVDVPPNVDIKKVYSLLEVGEKDDIWEFEEADYSR